MKQQGSNIQKMLQLCFSFMLIGFAFLPLHATADDGSVSDWLKDDGKEEQEKKQDEEDNIFDEDLSEEEQNDEESVVGLTAWNYIKTFFAFIFVIGLLYMLLKFVNRKNQLQDKNRLMKNMGGISLGQQKSVQLIVVGNTYYLVGVGEDIRLLKEITDPAEIEALLEQYEELEEIPFKGPFEKLLGKVLPFQKKEQKQEDVENEAFSNVLNERLTEIKADRKRQIHRLTEKEQSGDD